MHFELRVAVTGLCVLAPKVDVKQGTTDANIIVLMPATTQGSSADVGLHVPAIVYDPVYQTGGTNQAADPMKPDVPRPFHGEVIRNYQVRLPPVAAGSVDTTLPRGLLPVDTILGHKLPPTYATDTNVPDLAARVILSNGTVSCRGRGDLWRVGPDAGEIRYIDWFVEWVMPEMPGETLELHFDPINSAKPKQSITLRAIDRQINLRVVHLPLTTLSQTRPRTIDEATRLLARIPPAPRPKPGDPYDHLKAMTKLLYGHPGPPDTKYVGPSPEPIDLCDKRLANLLDPIVYYQDGQILTGGRGDTYTCMPVGGSFQS
jgi:hypothetical protein